MEAMGQMVWPDIGSRTPTACKDIRRVFLLLLRDERRTHESLDARVVHCCTRNKDICQSRPSLSDAVK